MNYIDADKLRAEIEKNTPNHLMLMVYRDHILALIDSLQQEQQEEPDKSLEKAADEWYEKCPAPKSTWWDEGEEMKLTDSKETFIAGAKWQKEQMLKDAVEGEAEELYNDGESQCTVSVGTYFKPGDEVYVIPKED